MQLFFRYTYHTKFSWKRLSAAEDFGYMDMVIRAYTLPRHMNSQKLPPPPPPIPVRPGKRFNSWVMFWVFTIFSFAHLTALSNFDWSYTMQQEMWTCGLTSCGYVYQGFCNYISSLGWTSFYRFQRHGTCSLYSFYNGLNNELTYNHIWHSCTATLKEKKKEEEEKRPSSLLKHLLRTGVIF